jgi:hypothetical protein
MSPFLPQFQAGSQIGVKYHALMPVPHQAPGDIRAHSPQTHDTNLHEGNLVNELITIHSAIIA